MRIINATKYIFINRHENPLSKMCRMEYPVQAAEGSSPLPPAAQGKEACKVQKKESLYK